MVRSPLVGGETQPSMRMVEDFPAPLGPRKPKASPRKRSKSIPSTAVKPPNRFVRPRACTRISGTDGEYPAAGLIPERFTVRPRGSRTSQYGTSRSFRLLLLMFLG